MLYGSRCWEAATGVDNLVRIDKRRSVDVFGVSTWVIELASAWRTAEVVAVGVKLISTPVELIGRR